MAPNLTVQDGNARKYVEVALDTSGGRAKCEGCIGEELIIRCRIHSVKKYLASMMQYILKQHQKIVHLLPRYPY